MAFSETDIDKPAKFVVRRVAENWEDTATTWQHQPTADSSVQVNKFIKVKNKNDIVSVDVTKLVLKMLRKGNNGFFISQEDSDPESVASGQFFASPKYGFEELRPLLVINYRRLLDPSIAFRQRNDMYPEVRNYNYRGIQMESGYYPVMEPVREPVPAPTPQPIVTPPVKD